MSKLFLTILNMSISSCYVILVVMAARLLLKRAPKAITCWLWAVVLFRLLCPVSLQSPISLLPAATQTIPENIGLMDIPSINSLIPAIDHTVNTVLPAGEPAMSANPMQIMLTVISIIWIIGIFLLLGYAVLSSWLLSRRLSKARHLEKNVFLANNLRTPFVLGIFHPRIYLPKGLSQEETVCILSHERTHILRNDHITKAIAFLTLSLHWFNPLAWAAFFLFGKDVEMACDEAVIRKLGPGIKKEYSSALLSLAIKHPVINGTPLAFGEGEVRGRIKNILHHKKPAVWVGIAAALAAAAICIGLALNPVSQSAAGEDSTYPDWLQKAWEWRTPYAGNASAVGNIIDAWYTLSDASKKDIELFTNKAPYGIKIHYTANSSLSPEEIYQNTSHIIEQNMIILFSLVQNLDYAEITFSEDVSYSYSRAFYEEQFGSLWEQSETLDSLSALYHQISLNWLAPYEEPEHTSSVAGSELPAAEAVQTPLTENKDYLRLLSLFPDYGNQLPPAEPVEADLNGDGQMEQIIASNLGHNGGDGGYRISVSRLVNGSYTEIPLPDSYTEDYGFPILMNWDGEKLKIIFGDSHYQEVPIQVLASIYEEIDMPDMADDILGNPLEEPADAISGFTVIEKPDGTSALVLKQYITGPDGNHSTRIGYGITELVLLKDNTWEISQYYLPAY